MSALTWSPFTQDDWYGLGGAEPFDDGSDPLYAELEVDDRPAFAVLDASGLYIETIATPDEEEASVSFPMPFAARAMAALRPSMTSVVLRAMPGSEAS